MASSVSACADALYGHVELQGYEHHSACHFAEEFVSGMGHTNRTELVWVALNCGFTGPYHNWSVRHCGRYMDEFAARLITDGCGWDTLDRMESLAFRVGGRKNIYRELLS